MRNTRRLILLVIVVGLLGYLYLEREMSAVHVPLSGSTPIEIPAGLSARGVLSLLHEQNLIGNEKLTLIYVVLTGNRKALRAGEYLFEGPVTTHDVINKLVSGEVHLHRFTVPEGLTVAEVASEWEKQGFGKAEEFLNTARDSGDLVQDLEGDTREASLEGYLFPETYSFPLRATPRQAIEAMTGRFRATLAQLNEEVPSEQWPLGVRETIILASLVEAEAAVDDERPLIASVYLNRLRRKILLQCDPTVIYALEKSNQYKGRLTRADLKFDSRYNTYRYPGLPPGPIANPGLRALAAATRPASSPYLFFVRTLEGRHTFSETLKDHNRAVAAYRVQQSRQKTTRR